MANWFTKLFNPTSYVEPLATPVEAPEVKTQAHPVEHNPGPTARVKRAAGRCATLMEAIEQTKDEERKKEYRRSLATYQAQLVAAGYDIPDTPEEARAMVGLE